VMLFGNQISDYQRAAFINAFRHSFFISL